MRIRNTSLFSGNQRRTVRVQEHGEQVFNERAAVVDEIPHRLIELLQQQASLPII
jgi:hypothetical protein